MKVHVPGAGDIGHVVFAINARRVHHLRSASRCQAPKHDEILPLSQQRFCHSNVAEVLSRKSWAVNTAKSALRGVMRSSLGRPYQPKRALRPYTQLLSTTSPWSAICPAVRVGSSIGVHQQAWLALSYVRRTNAAFSDHAFAHPSCEFSSPRPHTAFWPFPLPLPSLVHVQGWHRPAEYDLHARPGRSLITACPAHLYVTVSGVPGTARVSSRRPSNRICESLSYR